MIAGVDDRIIAATGARGLRRGDRIQSLWSGYGEILRARLPGACREAVVIKRVEPPTEHHHPRGWSSSLGHERKLRSYDVELSFYRHWAPRLSSDVRVAECLAADRDERGWWFVLEDLDESGFTGRRLEASPNEVIACLRWLAGFHAAFMQEQPDGLWAVGTYWHLDTRPEELAATEDRELVRAAPLLDARLSGCQFPTIVHGDAKLANFCFALDDRVAAVDFQYAGGGTGMKDVAYLLSSLRNVAATEANSSLYLDAYFGALRGALRKRYRCHGAVDRLLDAVEAEGRELFPLAWADFYRFLAGWAPDHWKVNGWGQRMTALALRRL